MASVICEDVWVPELAAEAAEAGAEILVNVSASPFHLAKGQERESMLSARAADNGIWLGGTVASGATEAEICWNCHDQTGNAVSEWGYNTKTTPAGSRPCRSMTGTKRSSAARSSA